MKGFALLTILPFMLITLSLCIMLADTSTTVSEMLSTSVHGARSDNAERNEAIRTLFNEELASCMHIGSYEACPLTTNGYRDVTPLFSAKSNCAFERSFIPPARDPDDILSRETCFDPLVIREVESFHSNLVIQTDMSVSTTKLLSVLGQTSVAAKLDAKNDLTIFSGGSILIHSIFVPLGKSITLISNRSITIDKLEGTGRVLKFELQNPLTFNQSIPLVPFKKAPVWSLQERVDIPSS